FAALSLVHVGFGTPTPSISLGEPQLQSYIAFNERAFTPHGNETQHVEQLSRRAESWSATHPGLKEHIDGAVRRTAGKVHYFWSGRTLPAHTNNDSVLLTAQKIAKQRGGTTLELTTEGVPMPDYGGNDPDAEVIWQYASDMYASASSGDTYVVKGESLRGGNVWEVYVSSFPYTRAVENMSR
ncbi:hypothetical protein EXIGLDRAFT_722693, partial [Exidia glandulosa HHB12029]